MKYVSISNTDPVAVYLTKTLSSHLLRGEKVTWLVPGGSSIVIAARVSQDLLAAGVPLNTLSVTLTDERYGELGNPNENWGQLETAGFAVPGASMYRVLQPDLSREETTEQFGKTLENLLTSSDFRLGFFGIGADGHTAGIKPRSFDMSTTDYAASFIGDDFERITMTPHAISQLDEAVVYAVGDEKSPVITELYYHNLPVSEQPAQALKTVPELLVFSDTNIGYEMEEEL